MATPAQSPPKHPGGRPLKFKTVKALQDSVDAYFADCTPHIEVVEEWVEARERDGKLKKDKNGLNYLVKVTHRVMTPEKPLLLTHLAVWLGVDRKTLLNYKKRDKFFPTIEGAMRRCEAYLEHVSVLGNTQGAKFSLINNYDWHEKSEVDHTTKGQPMPLLGGTIELPSADEGDDET